MTNYYEKTMENIQDVFMENYDLDELDEQDKHNFGFVEKSKLFSKELRYLVHARVDQKNCKVYIDYVLEYPSLDELSYEKLCSFILYICDQYDSLYFNLDKNGFLSICSEASYCDSPISKNTLNEMLMNNYMFLSILDGLLEKLSLDEDDWDNEKIEMMFRNEIDRRIQEIDKKIDEQSLEE